MRGNVLIFLDKKIREYFLKTGDTNHEYIPVRACSGSTAIDEVTNLWLSTASSHFCDASDDLLVELIWIFVMKMSDAILGKVEKKNI